MVLVTQHDRYVRNNPRNSRRSRARMENFLLANAGDSVGNANRVGKIMTDSQRRRRRKLGLPDPSFGYTVPVVANKNSAP